MKPSSKIMLEVATAIFAQQTTASAVADMDQVAEFAWLAAEEFVRSMPEQLQAEIMDDDANFNNPHSNT